MGDLVWVERAGILWLGAAVGGGIIMLGQVGKAWHGLVDPSGLGICQVLDVDPGIFITGHQLIFTVHQVTMTAE